MRRIVLAALVLAWATQVLSSQWASGSPAGQDTSSRQVSITVHMRASAKVEPGTGARLDDVCHLVWNGTEPRDAEGRTVGQVVVGRQTTGSTGFTVSVESVLRVLERAGVNPGRIQVEGPIRCEVTIASNDAAAKSDDEALLDWAGLGNEDSQTAAQQRPRIVDPSGAMATADERLPQMLTREPGSLADQLRQDLALRLELSPESLILAFRTEDTALLDRMDINAEQIRPVPGNDLGRVAWMLSLPSGEHLIQAEATAIVSRVRMVQPVGRGQTLRESDLALEQARVTRLAERGLGLDAAVGQGVARAMNAGEIVTYDRLAPRLLVRRGQYVTISLVRNGVEVRTLARALADAAFGQIVNVKNETSGEVLQVTITGPQAGTLLGG